MSRTKHVVSISLGSSTRDVQVETEILGTPVLIERRGVDGDTAKAKALFEALDGKVDAFGLGGTDLFIMVGGRRYYLRQSLKITRPARRTPVVCGAGLKDTLERTVVEKLEPIIGWRDKKVLMVLAADRFGMAEALDSAGAEMIFGDLIFGLGIPVPIKSLRGLDLVARLIAPVVTQVPIQWLYPTGRSQESSHKSWRSRYFDWADVIAGDFHYIRRYLPEQMPGKIVLTNTTTAEDVGLLRKRGGNDARHHYPALRWAQPADQSARGLVCGRHRQAPALERGLPGAVGQVGA
ncbi:MAG: hypothetical protein JSV66_00795, partial [Trueperaceae bacterium]